MGQTPFVGIIAELSLLGYLLVLIVGQITHFVCIQFKKHRLADNVQAITIALLFVLLLIGSFSVMSFTILGGYIYLFIGVVVLQLVSGYARRNKELFTNIPAKRYLDYNVYIFAGMLIGLALLLLFNVH